MLRESSREEALAVARQAGAMNAVAGKHFNRGQRAFFFSLAYLGWFVSAYLFIGATAGVLLVMWRRITSTGASGRSSSRLPTWAGL